MNRRQLVTRFVVVGCTAALPVFAGCAKVKVSTDEHPLCPLCSMVGDRSLKSVYKAKTYYFCSAAHKAEFDKNPARFTVAS